MPGMTQMMNILSEMQADTAATSQGTVFSHLIIHSSTASAPDYSPESMPAPYRPGSASCIDLFHLYRGGRVSKTAAVVGSMINLKPILHVDNEGHLIPLSKVRGRKKSLIALVDSMEKQIGAWRDKNDIVFISHGDSLEDAQLVAELIKKRLGIENFLINHIGPTIGAHSGPGTIALFYMGDYR